MASTFYESNLLKERGCLIAETYKSKYLYILFYQSSFRSTVVRSSVAVLLRTAILALVYSTAEYCASVWCRSLHTRLIDKPINPYLPRLFFSVDYLRGGSRRT